MSLTSTVHPACNATCPPQLAAAALLAANPTTKKTTVATKNLFGDDDDVPKKATAASRAKDLFGDDDVTGASDVFATAKQVKGPDPPKKKVVAPVPEPEPVYVAPAPAPASAKSAPSPPAAKAKLLQDDGSGGKFDDREMDGLFVPQGAVEQKTTKKQAVMDAALFDVPSDEDFVQFEHSKQKPAATEAAEKKVASVAADDSLAKMLREVCACVCVYVFVSASVSVCVRDFEL